ncbi:MAG: GAF domain-containing protein [Anaerolineae bacterium]|nr:GAF domain-containing protein [Anaerolineae bacterium]
MMEKELTSAITWNVFDDLSEGILLVDPAGQVVYHNQAASSLLGVSHHVDLLHEVNQVLASDDNWSELQNRPGATLLHTRNGRIVDAQSRWQDGVDGRLLQIVLRPPTTEPLPIDPLLALTQISQETDFEKQLQLLADGLYASGWQRVVITLRDDAFQPTHLITAGISPAEKAKLEKNLIPAQAWLALFTNTDMQKYRQGQCYFVPAESQWSQQHLQTTTRQSADSTAWQPKDVLCVPLYGRQQKLIGLVGLDNPVNGRRPDTPALQTIELYAQFAASLIENSRLVQETMDRSQEFELLLAASNDLSSSLETDTILSSLGQYMLNAIDADGYTIYEWQAATEKLVVLKEYTRRHTTTRQEPGTAVPVANLDLLETVLINKQPLALHIGPEALSPLAEPIWLPPDQPYNCALLPLILDDETYAIINLIKFGHKEITPRDLRLLAALANQASTALGTALIFEDTYERERFYGAMGNVSLALSYTLDRRAVLSLICTESLRIFNVQGAYIWQLDNDTFTSSAAKGHGEELFVNQTVPLSDPRTFVAHVVRTGLGLFLNNAQNSQMEIRLPHPEQIQALLGVPLEAEGSLIGVLILADTENPHRFTDRDVTQVTTFGVQVASALQNAKLFEELHQFNEELDLRVAARTHELNEESNRVKVLLRINTELSASLDQDRVLTKALDLVNEVVSANDGAILLLNQETGEFDFRATLNKDKQLTHRSIPSGLKRDEGLAGWMLQHRTAVIVYDTKQDPRWLELPTSSAYRSVLGVPLITNEEVMGVLLLFHNEPHAFTNQQLDLVEAAAVQVANAINNANLYNLIFDQADQLGTILRGEIIQKANLQAILESIADGVIVADNKNEIEIANASASKILAIPRQQLIGKPVNQLLGVYGQFGDTWMSTINDWAKNSDQIPQGIYLADQLAIEEKYVSIHLSPVLSESNFFGTVSIFRDITKDVEVDRLKSEFVSTVSHELRTPMTSIKGYADLMLMGAAGQLTDPQIRYLKVIKSNADRLHDLVNDLLNISRIETGKTTLDLRPLDIPQLIEQAVGHLHGRIQHEEKPMSVKTEIAPGLPLVNADQTRVTQILTNLVDNAFNYTPADGQIIIHARATEAHVYISISDNGIGISKENREKIFDRFFRAEDEAVQKVSGTGLGLAIVRSLIEMHGGYLQVESELGKGSTFTFNLPVVIEDSDPT